MGEGNGGGVRKAAPCRIRREQRNGREGAVELEKGLLERWRAVRRYEGNRKIGARKLRIARTEGEFDFASKAAGPSINERDSVAAVLGQVALCIADDEHVRKEHESYGAEVTTIDMSHESLGRVVVLAPDHLPNIHDSDVPASAVLQKLVIVNAPVVIDDIGSLAIFAH